jgi:hypothetical protein
MNILEARLRLCFGARHSLADNVQALLPEGMPGVSLIQKALRPFWERSERILFF